MKSYERLSRSLDVLTPPKVKKVMIEMLTYSGSPIRAHVVTGTSNLLFILFFTLSAYLLYTFVPSPWNIVSLLASPIGAIIPYGLFFFIFYFKAEKRTKLAEAVLPDVLHMIAANLRSGMTAYDAVKAASTRDFGPLSAPLRQVSSRSLGQHSFSDAISEVPTTIKSDALRRSMSLFASSLRSGGHVAELLDGLAQDILDRQSLRKELVVNTMTNAMFIFFTIVIGTPTLLAISIYFVDVVNSLQSSTASSDSGQFGLSGLGGEIDISVGFLTGLSYVMLVITGVIATLFIGGMIEGDQRKGLKYAPLIVSASIGIFFIARFVINTFLGNPLG